MMRFESPRYDVSLLDDYPVHLFREGTYYRMYETLGSHPMHAPDGVPGCYFSVWAPNAKAVSVIGEWNDWNPHHSPLRRRWEESGLWEGFLPGVVEGRLYKYKIESSHESRILDKSDPMAFSWETSPATASRIWNLDYEWNDEEWMANRHRNNSLSSPCAVYEVHLGSWCRVIEEKNRHLTYREAAERLADYVAGMGFTHVEFLPLMEHPFYGSWGYQTIGYFAPTSRYGSPQDFMYLIDRLHQRGIGVILDWVPSHFPSDEHGLGSFDGTHLYEHADPRQGFHPDWKTFVFNYGRNEVRCFLLSSAHFWLDKYHIDGLRVDAVASMLYLDYSRGAGEWVPNRFGGRENIDAIAFLRQLNTMVYERFPDAQTFAEESTTWPMVSRPVYTGGLGFGLKWNMGWMNDTLAYFSKEPIHRKYHHNQLTFSIMYAFNENFILPLSHDEVVYGKGSLLAKMPGDDWRKRANLRLLLGYMFMHPGKKLLFMGGEFGQWNEWNHDSSLDWHLLDEPAHQGIRRWVRDVLSVYRSYPALYRQDFSGEGFRWIDCNDIDKSVVLFSRHGNDGTACVIAINGTPVPHSGYHIGVDKAGFWRELLNSDAVEYGGSGVGNLGGRESVAMPTHGRENTLVATLPPLSIVVFSLDR